MITRFLVAGFALFTCNIQAAVLVEIKTQSGLTRVYSDGPRTRMSLEDQTYIVVDSKAETLYVVNPGNRQVTDMSRMLKEIPQATDSSPAVDFEKLGSGPRIAGYQTTRYRYLVGAVACGTLLASEQALNDTGLADAFKLVQRLSLHADAMTKSFNHPAATCKYVAGNFSAHVEKVGIPMRITGANGRVESEIVRIEKNTRLPPNAFTVPAGYQKEDAGRRMNESEQQMLQMQESGQIPADILEKFQQMQKK